MGDEATSHQWVAGSLGGTACGGPRRYRRGGPGAGQGDDHVLDTFQDEFLTEACGVEVTTTATGRLTFFTFPDRPVGPQDLTSVHVDFLAVAGDNQARFKDIGIDKVQVKPDGTVILSIVGQVPFEFTGVVKINLDTGEVIHEAHHIVDTTRVCRLLTR